MKNKKVVILLLVLAAGIWGTIAYRILNAIHHENPAQIKTPQNDSELFSSLSDTFSISGNYRDPFLGKRAMQIPAKQPVEVKSKSAPITAKWPDVSFSGVIRSNTKQLALVKISQKDFIMKAGDIVMGIELSKIFKDSIVVLYQKEKKVIAK